MRETNRLGKSARRNPQRMRNVVQGVMELVLCVGMGGGGKCTEVRAGFDVRVWVRRYFWRGGAGYGGVGLAGVGGSGDRVSSLWEL